MKMTQLCFWMLYLHGLTGPLRVVAENCSLVVDQRSMNGSSANKKQIPQDGIYTKPVTGKSMRQSPSMSLKKQKDILQI